MHITSLVFAAVLATGCVLSYRGIRTDNFGWTIYGSLFIGYTLIMAQLDHLACDSPQPVLTFAIFLAFLAFLMAIVRKDRAATEYALLSSVFALSRSVAGWAGGLGAQSMGYANWFLLTFFFALPAAGAWSPTSGRGR